MSSICAERVESNRSWKKLRTLTTRGGHVALASRAVPIEKRLAAVMAVLFVG